MKSSKSTKLACSLMVGLFMSPVWANSFDAPTSERTPDASLEASAPNSADNTLAEGASYGSQTVKASAQQQKVTKGLEKQTERAGQVMNNAIKRTDERLKEKLGSDARTNATKAAKGAVHGDARDVVSERAIVVAENSYGSTENAEHADIKAKREAMKAEHEKHKEEMKAKHEEMKAEREKHQAEMKAKHEEIKAEREKMKSEHEAHKAEKKAAHEAKKAEHKK